jgi:hypothetical protein
MPRTAIPVCACCGTTVLPSDFSTWVVLVHIVRRPAEGGIFGKSASTEPRGLCAPCTRIAVAEWAEFYRANGTGPQKPGPKAPMKELA